MSEERRRGIVAAARELVGTSYLHQGRSTQGIDCGGVVVLAARAAGLLADYIDLVGYRRVPHGGKLEAQVESYMETVPGITAALPGDVALMTWGRQPMHVAIFGNYLHDALTPPLSLIHAYQSVGRVVEHRLDETWCARIVAVYRFKEIA